LNLGLATIQVAAVVQGYVPALFPSRLTGFLVAVLVVVPAVHIEDVGSQEIHQLLAKSRPDAVEVPVTNGISANPDVDQIVESHLSASGFHLFGLVPGDGEMVTQLFHHGDESVDQDPFEPSGHQPSRLIVRPRRLLGSGLVQRPRVLLQAGENLGSGNSDDQANEFRQHDTGSKKRKRREIHISHGFTDNIFPAKPCEMFIFKEQPYILSIAYISLLVNSLPLTLLFTYYIFYMLFENLNLPTNAESR